MIDGGQETCWPFSVCPALLDALLTLCSTSYIYCFSLAGALDFIYVILPVPHALLCWSMVFEALWEAEVVSFSLKAFGSCGLGCIVMVMVKTMVRSS